MRHRFAESGQGSGRRDLLWQGLAVGLLLLAAWLVAGKVESELAARGIRSGFSFLLQPTGFEIGESLFEFHAGLPYWQAFLVGFANTLRVALPGLVLATIFGALIGFGRLSTNFLLRGLCAAYVEVFRNIPLLLQLLTWYFLLTEKLPLVADAVEFLPGFFLSKSGLAFPMLVDGALDWPLRGALNIEGGATVTPEYLAVLLGLVAYAAAYLAEIVRAGILSVSRGQVEAAAALGLSASQRLRWVVLPQALRLIVPPAGNQYLNLTKNSSLAVVVGYPDLVSIANTTLNQTGQAVECISILIAVYLLLSLLTAALLARYNERLLGKAGQG
ncbi:ABC transporter permease subunit [Propionivibrio sp.]|uniref:ABC transporter permease subunit n=1 Tax=Propionivibrio sp. TaxID=2212460 RepID=UPI003BF3C8AA